MMVEHFHEQVIAKGKIGGRPGDDRDSQYPRCIEYYHAVNHALSARRSPYKAIIAFSGERVVEKGTDRGDIRRVERLPGCIHTKNIQERPVSLSDRSGYVPDWV
jgi:hypothetical protein